MAFAQNLKESEAQRELTMREGREEGRAKNSRDYNARIEMPGANREEKGCFCAPLNEKQGENKYK